MKLTFSLYPTPIYRLHQCEKEISSKAQIWIKREDQCGEQYGGNKVRKLEYILNEAQKKGAKTVFSIGALGSNHVLATSIYAHKIKLHNVAFLVPQPYQDYVKKNILGSLALDTDLIYLSPTRMIFVPFIFLYYYFKYWIKDKAKPYLIWFGGSSKLGSLGSFDMAQELVSQIKNNEMPKPDMIFVPVGTCGTMSGVVLAMKMFDPSIKVCGVSVFNSLGANTKTVATLVNGMITLLKLKTSKIKSSDV